MILIFHLYFIFTTNVDSWFSRTSVRGEQTLVPALSFCQAEVVRRRASLCAPAYICMSAYGVLTSRRSLNMFNKLSDETGDKSCERRRVGQGQTIVKRRFTFRDTTPERFDPLSEGGSTTSVSSNKSRLVLCSLKSHKTGSNLGQLHFFSK